MVAPGSDAGLGYSTILHLYHSDRVEHLCSNTRVKLLCLLPYSPDLNPIMDFSAELRRFQPKLVAQCLVFLGKSLKPFSTSMYIL